MARGDDPGERDDVVLHLHGGRFDGARRQVHGVRRVVDGMAAVDAIEASPVNGETPVDAHRSEGRAHREEVMAREGGSRGAHRVGGGRGLRVLAPRAAARSVRAGAVRRAAGRFGDYSLSLHLSRPCTIDAAHPLLLYATGDGGWRGKDKDAFEHMTALGVSAGRLQRARLPEAPRADAARDAAARRRARLRADDRAGEDTSSGCPTDMPTVLVGVSRGSGLAVAAAGDPALQRSLVGVVAIALTREEEYVHRLRRGAAGRARTPSSSCSTTTSTCRGSATLPLVDHPVDQRRLPAGGRGAPAARARFAAPRAPPDRVAEPQLHRRARRRCTPRCRRRSPGSATSCR